MSEYERENPDVATPPSERDLSMVGSVLMAKIREAIAHDRLLGYETDGTWTLEVEGSGALVDDRGRGIDPTLKVGIGSPEDERARPVYVMVVRLEEGGSGEVDEADVYRVDYLKNTEVVDGLSKATITKDFVDVLDDGYAEEVEVTLEAGRGLLDVITGLRRAVERRADRFGDELDTQMSFGACTQDEAVQLLEILQRSRPSTEIPEFGF